MIPERLWCPKCKDFVDIDDCLSGRAQRVGDGHVELARGCPRHPEMVLKLGDVVLFRHPGDPRPSCRFGGNWPEEEETQ